MAPGTRFNTGLLCVTALAVLFVKTNSKKSKPLCFSSCTQERLKGTPNSGRGSDCHITPHTPLDYLKSFKLEKRFNMC